MSVQTNLQIVEQWKILHLEEQKSHVEIGKLYGVHRETVRRNLKKIGIKSINYQNMCKHDINKFQIIQTEEDAYWLGFIYADGYVSNKNNFEISLKGSDSLHLEKFKSYLKLSLDVKFGKINEKYDRCRISYKNKNLVDNLKNLGVIPRKSLILNFPNNKKIPNCLIKHFIRGYFDGDATVSLYKLKKNNRERLYISLLGTKNFLDGVRIYSPITFGKYIKNNGSELTLVLSTADKKARTFLDWLYKDSTIYLNRKYEKYKLAVLNRNI